MGQDKEEVLATILWRFIEQLREQECLGGDLALNPAEARELLGLLALAANVGEALSPAEEEQAAHLRARQRLALAILEKPSPSPVGTRPRTPVRTPAPPLRSGGRGGPAERGGRSPGLAGHVPALARSRWTWASLAATAAVAAGLLGLHIGRSLPPPDPLTHPPASVRALSHQRVRQWLPRLLRGQLSPQKSRAMWWHLAHCDDCFHAYQQMSPHAPHGELGTGDAAGGDKLLAFARLTVGKLSTRLPPAH